jgi:hypothetical protein
MTRWKLTAWYSKGGQDDHESELEDPWSWANDLVRAQDWKQISKVTLMDLVGGHAYTTDPYKPGWVRVY